MKLVELVKKTAYTQFFCHDREDVVKIVDIFKKPNIVINFLVTRLHIRIVFLYYFYVNGCFGGGAFIYCKFSFPTICFVY